MYINEVIIKKMYIINNDSYCNSSNVDVITRWCRSSKNLITNPLNYVQCRRYLMSNFSKTNLNWVKYYYKDTYPYYMVLKLNVIY